MRVGGCSLRLNFGGWFGYAERVECFPGVMIRFILPCELLGE